MSGEKSEFINNLKKEFLEDKFGSQKNIDNKELLSMFKLEEKNPIKTEVFEKEVKIENDERKLEEEKEPLKENPTLNLEKENKKVLIQIKDLYKKYNKNKILNGINFEVRQNEVLGILGLSGTGKTTLMRILCGIENASFGKIISNINGKKIDILRHTNKSIKSFIGYSVQDFSIYDELTIMENFHYFSKIFFIEKNQAEVLIFDLLKIFKLEAFVDYKVKDLSTGLKKRVDIICSLLYSPQVLLLDEPTESLDFELREELFNLIKKLKQKGLTIIFISHILEEIQRTCDRVLILNKGDIFEVGNIANLKLEFTQVLKNG